MNIKKELNVEIEEPYFLELNADAEGTSPCDEGHKGCLYLQDGRCIYNIAPCKNDLYRACR